VTLRFVSILALPVLAVLACSSPEETVKRHLERAQVYEESGQIEQAQAELQAALKVAPQNPATNLRLATLLERGEQWDTALFYYEEAHRLDPANDDAALGVAHLLRFSETDRADALIEEVIARNPRSTLAHILRSDVLLVRNDFAGALASALTATELDPNHTRAALQVAAARKAPIAERRVQGQPDDPKLFEAADVAFARAIELAKDHDLYWLPRATDERVALLVAWRGYTPEQSQIFRDSAAALKDRPVLQGRVVASAVIHARAARDAELRQWALSRLIEISPSSYEAWVELADLATERGEDGLEILARMVEKLPDDPQAQITYSDQLMVRGRHAEAAAHLEKVRHGSSAPAAMLAALVQVHLGAGDGAAAHAALEELNKDYPDSGPADQAEAMLADAEGRLPDAVAALERWTGREETANGLGLLADARLRSGNPRAALDTIDRAIALKEAPRFDLHALRGRILVQLGEFRTALQAFVRANQLKGGPLPIAYMPDVATAFYEIGRDEEARQALERALAEKSPPPGAFLLFAHNERERDPKGAREVLERGYALYPGVLQFVAALANADLRDRKPEAALERVRSAAAALPESPDAQILLVRMLVNVERTDEAVKTVEAIQERWPGQVGVAELYLSVMTYAGRADEAFQKLSQKHAAGELSPHGRVLLAGLEASRGADDKAIELLRSALEDVPNLPAAANNLAYLLARRGEDLQEATELAQEARAARPDSAEVADTLGFVYMRRNLAEAALVQFDAALDLSEPESPAWATAQYHRGLALRELGRQEEAVTAVEQALASGADFPESKDAHRVLAELANAAPPTAGARDGS
jgi:tetratricopeptide (TPR) repeat protein